MPDLPARKRRLLCVAFTEPAWGLCEGRPWALQREMAGLLLRMANHPSLDSLDGCEKDLDAAADRLTVSFNALRRRRPASKPTASATSRRRTYTACGS